MTTRSPSPKLTYEDLLRLPEDRLRHELISGEHYMTPSPAVQHQRIVLNLGRMLSAFVRARRLGEVFVAPLDVLFSNVDVVEPDLLYVSRGGAGKVQERFIAGAPDLVVEVLSESTRGVDKIKKRRLYERSGVREYWIVDPALETVEVYRAAGRHFARRAPLSRTAGDTLETPLLPGLRVPLRKIFE